MKKNCTVLVFVFVLFGVFIFNSCEQNHFITDKQYRRAVTDQFNQRQDLAKNRYELLFDVFQDKLSGTEKEALMFLYAYMPLNDLADYDGKYFLDQVRVSLKAKREMPWGINIPEDIFRNFVLPYRVNNENLDTFRLACYDELKERVQGLTLKDAIMEINHWCHEKVSYQPADIRTSSPMNTVKSARGRCGEESTFTVMALRTVSIPARQVYTPRWAHSDDNHAWVEVWVDGTWHYLGACEPEPDFNMGWFKEPARRAMLVHTKAFGAYNGDEQLVQKQNNFAEINSLFRYAKVKELFVNIQDTNGRPVDSASVEFKLYNFAEFYPLARLYTDKNGYTSFTTGFGYILIWSTKNGSFGFEKISVEDADTVIIILDKKPGREYDLEWDLIPPVAEDPFPVNNEGREENKRRLKEEDKIRMAYVSGFMDSVQAVNIANELNLNPDHVWNIVRKSMGNYEEIAEYLQKASSKQKDFTLSLLDQVSEKDLRDVPASVLLDHLENSNTLAADYSVRDRELFVKYILNPRVANELLTDYRKYLQEAFKKEFDTEANAGPDEIIDWINNNISIMEEENYYRVPITPKGVYDLKVSDLFSRKIFFVAAARSLGIPARLEPMKGIPQYYTDDAWQDVYFDGDFIYPSETGIINLIDQTPELIPEYHIHYTLAYFREGSYFTLRLGWGSSVIRNGNGLKLPVGHYMLVTGNRVDNGKVLCKLTFFTLEEGENKTLPVKLRKAQHKEKNYGTLDLTLEIKSFSDGKPVKLVDLSQQHEFIVTWIDPDREPTKHIMNDIPLLKEQFDRWGGKLLFLVQEQNITSSFNPENYNNLPDQTAFFIDEKSRVLNQLNEALGNQAGSNLPLVIIVKPTGQVTYLSEGYRIGIGEQLVKAIEIKKLKIKN